MKRILQNSFGKTILCLLVALMSGGTSWAAVSTTPYKTALFAEDNCSQLAAYGLTSSWYSTTDGFRVNVENFNNGWWALFSVYYGHIRCGDSPASITTAAPIDKAIAKVDLTIDNAPRTGITSIKLWTSVDYENWVEAGGFTVAAGKQTVGLSSPEANLFYKIEVIGTRNYDDLRISKVEYYNEVPDPNAVATPVISGNPEPIFDTSTEVTISCEEDGATIEYSTDGTTWVVYENPFILKHTATVKARATKAGKNASQEASKTFSHRDDVHDVTWNLKQAPTGTSSERAVTWTRTVSNEYFATMTLQKSGSSTNAYNFLGGTNDHTRFYQNQTLTIKPLPGYSIVYVEFTCQDNTAGGLNGTWTNATASVSGTTVIVTPSDGTASISTTISSETHVTGVKVHYSLSAPPYIEVAEETVNATSALTTNTIGVVYSDELNPANAEVIVGDENDEQAGEGFWLTAELDDDYNLTYTIAPNTTTEARTAYIAVHVQGVYSHTITVTQNAPVIVSISYVGYGTLYYQHLNLVVPDGIEAYTYTYIPGNNRLTRNTIYRAGDVIPKNSPVALKSETVPARGETIKYAFVESSEAPDRDDENLLLGSENGGMTTGDGSYFYALAIKKGSNDPSTIGFYWMVEGGGAFTIGAHKAYLNLHQKFTDMISGATGGVKDFVSLSDEEDPTGINEVEFNFEEDSNAIYNLSGQSINKMQNGINIINGKKILK